MVFRFNEKLKQRVSGEVRISAVVYIVLTFPWESFWKKIETRSTLLYTTRKDVPQMPMFYLLRLRSSLTGSLTRCGCTCSEEGSPGSSEACRAKRSS